MSMARRPEDLHDLWQRFFVAGDADGLTNLYEKDALVVTPQGRSLQGHDQIREFFQQFVKLGITMDDITQRPAIINGNLAITSMTLASGSLTCEVARRQPDGSWLWAIDKPRFS